MHRNLILTATRVSSASPNPLFILLLLSHFMRPLVSLRCLEGADCIPDASCTACEGVACTRVTSLNSLDNKHMALTCVPYDTREYARGSALEEDGCRLVERREICVCSEADYCNQSSMPSNSFPRTLLIFAVLLLRLL